MVDDASCDDTLDLLHNLAQQHPGWIRVIALNANEGAAHARNAGWEAASQPYIAFLDADDAWHPKKIELQYAYMAAHPDVTLSGHAHRLVKQPHRLPDWNVGQCPAQGMTRRGMLMSNRFVTPSVMLKRDMSHRFLSGKRHIDDHLLWLELICEGHKIVKLSAELAAIYKPIYGTGGLSSELWLMERSELDNYARLRTRGCLNPVQWLLLSSYSLLKYGRRLIIYGLYLRWFENRDGRKDWKTA